MKYVSQINGLLAAVGLLVTLFALFQTILAPREARYLDVEALRVRYVEEAPPPVREAPGPPAGGESAVTTARSGLVMPMGTPGGRTVTGSAGRAVPTGTRGEGPRRPTPTTPSGVARRPVTGTEVRAGAPAAAGEESEAGWRDTIRVRPGFPPPGAAERVLEDSGPARRPQPRFRPPARAEELKRDTSPEGPPVRGSAVP